MYLEMLQQRYGAAMEKQAMEKQALNPMQLVQMGRRFAARGKMDRFGQLIAKRNNVIKNTDVFAKRRELNNKLMDKALEEYDWLGHTRGPAFKQYRVVRKRNPDSSLTQENLQRLKSENPDLFALELESSRPMGAVRPDILADWSHRLRNMGL